MKRFVKIVISPILALACSLAVTANAHDATEELFSFLDKGGCKPDSLTDRNWLISTSPVGTHGELVLGDILRFELLEDPAGIAKKSKIQVLRNGVPWESKTGWYGQCMSDGTISQYIISGDFDVDGCLHELAVGRLDHDDSLTNRIELVFQDSHSEEALECESYDLRHPGHAHGTEDED